jgi:hypothetical protein
MTAVLTYWHIGGGVMCAVSRDISSADAAALGDLYMDEARAAAEAGCPKAQAMALRLARELSNAAEAAGRWRRAGAYPATG